MRSDVQRAFTAIALFVAAALLAFLQRPWRVPQFIWSAARSELKTRVWFGIGLLAFTLAFLKYAVPSGFDFPEMIAAIGGSRWEGPWTRGSLGGADAFLDHLSYFGYLLPPLTVVLARRLGWSDRRPQVLGILSLILAVFIFHDGGRRLLGFFVGSAGVVWFLGAQRLRPTKILGLLVLIMGLLAVMDVMREHRNEGIAEVLQHGWASERDTHPRALIRVDDNFLRLAQITSIFPAEADYTTWRYPLWVAVRPVPRLFWPEKPVDPGFDLSRFLGAEGVSLSSSVIGELFMAGGFIGVLLGGWLYGGIARTLSHFLAMTGTQSGLLIYSIGLLALFVGMRSMIELVLMSYVVLAWVVSIRIYLAYARPRGR